MTAFEYVAISTSLILSFSFARTISNFASIFLSGRRYWIHSTWVILLVFNHLIVFFGTATNKGVESWTFGRVCGVLVVPIFTLVAASLAVPNNQSVQSYRRHFEAIRAPFYVVWCLSIAVSAWGAYTLGFADPAGLAVFLCVSTVFAVGAIVRNQRFDQVMVVLTVLWYASMIAVIWDSVLFDPMLLDL